MKYTIKTAEELCEIAVRNLVLNSGKGFINDRAISLKVNVMHSRVDVNRYSVANTITRTSATKLISPTVILYRTLLLLLHVYYQTTCGLLLLHNQLKRLHSDKQYRCNALKAQLAL